MEPQFSRLCYKDFVSSFKVMFLIFPRIKPLYSSRRHSSQKNYNTPFTSCENSCQKALSRKLEKRQKRSQVNEYLQHLFEQNKIKTSQAKTKEKNIESKFLMSSMNQGKNSSKTHNRLLFRSLMYKAFLSLGQRDSEDATFNKMQSEVIYQSPAEQVVHQTDCGVMDMRIGNPNRSVSFPQGDYDSKSTLNLQISAEGCQLNDRSSTTEDLYLKMGVKYQEPSEKEVERLKGLFPEPEELFHAAMAPAKDAGLKCHEPPEVSSHLREFYWKAKIRLLWPRRVIVTGSDIDKQGAITRMYLEACWQLVNLGVMMKSGDSYQPMTCDTVINFLEQISDCNESSISSSRGKGFKIILEKEKVQKNSDQSVDRSCCHNFLNGKVCCEWEGCETAEDGRSVWSCCVHVGWPVPFSVRMLAPSLPSAQMLALLTTGSNLKVIGVLNKYNNGVNRSALQLAVMSDTSRLWYTNSSSSRADNQLHQGDEHSLDAKIFVDASNVGFGAYLTLKDSDKVNWLSESWLHQPQICPSIFFQREDRFQMVSTVAELFALVSTVFSWKRKLQHRQLACYSDNQTVVLLIKTLKHKAAQPSTPVTPCLNIYDQLITTLNQTCKAYNINLSASWIKRENNWLADRLANGDLLAFKTAVPNAASQKTKGKRLQLSKHL